jgi:hypothetical protein
MANQFPPINQQLSAAENQSGRQPTDNPAEIAEQEKNSDDFYDAHQPTNQATNKQAKPKLSPKQKGWLLTAIFGLSGGGLLATGFVLGPSLLLVNISDKMQTAFNRQLAQLDNHSRRLWGFKLRAAACTGSAARCKFHTMSDKQVKKLTEAGFELRGANQAPIQPGGGRAAVTEIKAPNGDWLNAKNFDQAYRTNAAFRKSLHGVYNPKYAGFADKVFAKHLGRTKSTKAKILTENSEEGMKKQIKETTNNGAKKAVVKSIAKTIIYGDDNKPVAYQVGDEEIKISDYDSAEEAAKAADAKAAAINQSADDLASEFNDTEKTAKGAINDAGDSLGKTNLLKKALGFVSLTGTTDMTDKFCGLFNALRAVNYGIKAVRSIQLFRFAMIFMNTADAIKAGDASPQQVSYLGNMLTQTIRDRKSQDIIVSSATDSYAYKYAAFGDAGLLTPSMANFTAAAVGGPFQAVEDGLVSAFSDLGIPLKDTCKVVRSLSFQIADAALGLAVNLIPGAGQSISATVKGLGAAVKTAVTKAIKEGVMKTIGKKLISKTALKLYGYGAANISFELLINWIPQKLTEIVDGEVIPEDDASFVGEQVMDAIGSGIDDGMAKTALAGGNAPLKPDEATAYQQASQATNLAYAEENRVGSVWWDINNPSTLFGSVAQNLFLRLYGAGGLTGTLSRLGQLLTSSWRSMIRSRSAEAAKSFQCADRDTVEAGFTCDPLGVTAVGLTKYVDVEEALDAVDGLANIDDGMAEPIGDSPYKTFYETCSGGRTAPLFTSPPEQIDADEDSLGQRCGQTDKASDDQPVPNYVYYNAVGYIRANGQMDGDAMEDMIGQADADDSDSGQLAWPIAQPTKISSCFGPRHSPCAGCSSFHKGLDLGAPHGTELLAVANGTVASAGYESCGGNFLFIDHDGGLTSGYLHLDSVRVSVGDNVKKGDIVAISDNTGSCTTGAHLHFIMKQDGAQVNPLKFLSPPYDLSDSANNPKKCSPKKDGDNAL